MMRDIADMNAARPAGMFNPKALARALLALVLLFVCAPADARLRVPEADSPGVADHPVIGRIPGSLIAAGSHRKFARIGYPERMDASGRKVEAAGQAEGEAWDLVYWLPADIGPDAAAAIYRKNLEKLGLEILIDQDDPKGLAYKALEPLAGVDFPPLSRPIHMLVARGKLRGRDAVVAVYAFTAKTTWGKDNWLFLQIVESGEVDDRLEIVTAEKIGADISGQGRVILEGILFDHDSERLKPASRPALEQIAAWLKANPEARVFVVGHTDATGKYEYNLDLSRRRAASVVKALTRDHAVDPGRLLAVGIGPVAPVASNQDEAGRAKNRRVELVLRLD